MFPPEEMQGAPPPDNGGEGAGIDAKLRDEMREWIRMEIANEMRAQYGKPMPGAGAGPEGELPPEMPPQEEDAGGGAGAGVPEDADIPGVEGAPPGEAPGAGGPDMEKLKAALARMKGAGA
jgi:hypothetical protein